MSLSCATKQILRSQVKEMQAEFFVANWNRMGNYRLKHGSTEEWRQAESEANILVCALYHERARLANDKYYVWEACSTAECEHAKYCARYAKKKYM
jgi:hypothetical protein